jgi:hypothetical protein
MMQMLLGHQSNFLHFVKSLRSYLQNNWVSAPLLVGILCLWILLLLSLCRSGTSLFDNEAHSREALKALLSLINPTRSFWPIDISQAISSARKTKVIKLSLRQLFVHIVSGTLEFRNPSVDLVKLLKDGEYCVNGWSIQLAVDTSWWSVVSIWIFKSFAWTTDVSTCVQSSCKKHD